MEGLTITPQLMVVGGIAGLAALAAIGVVAFNNAIRSALCLVLNFFLLAVLYFTLNAQFLGIIQIVVYTGAIMVLFLFVIMLLNLGGMDIVIQKNDPKLIFGGVLGLCLFGLIAGQVFLPLRSLATPKEMPVLVDIPRDMKRQMTPGGLNFESVSAQDVLAKFFSKTGAKYQVDSPPSEQVSLDLSHQPMLQALTQLAQSTSSSITYSGGTFTFKHVTAIEDLGKPESVGTALFSGYVWPFELASILLLIGIVGSILLAKRRLIPTKVAAAAVGQVALEEDE